MDYISVRFESYDSAPPANDQVLEPAELRPNQHTVENHCGDGEGGELLEVLSLQEYSLLSPV